MKRWPEIAAACVALLLVGAYCGFQLEWMWRAFAG